MKNSNYKTTICKYYEARQECNFGSKCKFAHGNKEVRQYSDDYPNSSEGYCKNSKQPYKIYDSSLAVKKNAKTI